MRQITGLEYWCGTITCSASSLSEKKANVVLCFKNTYKCYKIEKQIFLNEFVESLGEWVQTKKGKEQMC